ncbi:MAG: SMP-30/gluconolactonase/LRE family protein, partial [Planctomycetales bacterium]|nr:SMP-30/gluconolactonase/LRE family protein [Planctomycetales bacterium]
PNNVVFRWKEGEGIGAYLKPSGFTGTETKSPEPGSNGLAIDAEGRLLLCQHGDRRLARMEAATDAPKAAFTTLADRFEGKRFNSPNDLAVHSSGAVYFTDPPYGLPERFNDPQKEIDFQGVYRLSPTGQVALLTGELTAPNGIALSPDESMLYVAQSDPQKAIVMAYDLTPDGRVENPRVLFDATPLLATRTGNPDGLKVDQQGNLFATGPGGVLVLTPDGRHLGTIMTGERIANCAFGDDGRTLYMTSDMHLCRVRLKTIGDGFKKAAGRPEASD